jgi:outer membrane biosynthesis protein TonB
VPGFRLQSRLMAPFRPGPLALALTLSSLVLCLAVVPLRGFSSGRNVRSVFEPGVGIHESRGHESGGSGRSQSEASVSPQDTEQQQINANPMPATRGSFMAVWTNVNGASGYRLDVSTDASFASFVSAYQDLDVGNVTSRIVAGLKPGTRYYYRVRAYDASGANSSGNSDTATVQTTSSNSGLVINPTFDSSITRNSKAALIESEINQAIAVYQSLFSDPVNVSIVFRYSNTSATGQRLPNGVVAQSFFVIYPIPWDNFLSALRADAKTPNDASANNSLPSFALSSNIFPSSANGRAVGLDTPGVLSANGSLGTGGQYDGIVTLNSSVSIVFSRPAGANSYDGLSAIEHEMDEVLGLGSYLNGNASDLRPQDLFSWSGFGNRNTTRSGSRYFSIDGGQTDIVNFNQDSTGDAGDWESGSCPQANPKVQNAFGCQGQSSDVAATSPEGINVDVIGYDLAVPPPPPVANPATNVTSSSFVANWTGVTAVSGYRLDVSPDPSFATFVSGYNNLDVGNVTNAVVNGLTDNTPYHYRVRARNSFGTSGSSNIVTVFTSSENPTATPTVTPTPTATISPTPTPTVTPTPTETPSPTPTPTSTPTATPSPTPTPTPTPTATPTPLPVPPTVSLSVFPGSVSKGGTATFSVFASANASQPIVVNYTMSGTAGLGTDYTLDGLPDQMTIPAGQSAAETTLTVTTTKTRGSEKAIMTLTPGSGYDLPAGSRRRRARPPQATVTIQNR